MRAPAGDARAGSARAYRITLRAMRFHALIGILPHERELPQPVEVDLAAWVDGDEGVVDYRVLHEAARGAIEDGPVEYLEDACEAIAARVLAVPRVRRVRVAVRKPHVALPGPLAYAEVAATRTRGSAP